MKTLFLLLGLAVALQAQTTKILPDCAFSVAISGAGASATGANTSTGCSVWLVSWEGPAGGGYSVTVQSAPTGSGGGAGTWATYAGSVSSGSNPSTDRFGTVALFGYVPFIRVSWNGSGTLSGRIFGWKDPGAIGSSGGSSSSSTGYGLPACTNAPLRLAISVTGTGATEVIPATSGQIIRICKIQFAGDTATGLRFVQGGGTNCGTGTTNVSGVFANTTALAFDYDGSLILSSGNAFCLSSSVASAIGGLVTYVKE